jgi:hypothetical protein
VSRLIGLILATCIIALWGVIFMCVCRVVTGQWWMTDDIGETK